MNDDNSFNKSGNNGKRITMLLFLLCCYVVSLSVSGFAKLTVGKPFYQLHYHVKSLDSIGVARCFTLKQGIEKQIALENTASIAIIRNTEMDIFSQWFYC